MTVWATELAAFDFETTGLSAQGGDRVLEVAVVRGRHGETPRTWSTLVHPGRPVSATQVHGITDAMIASAPRFPEVLDTLADALSGALVVAHNARFDMGFLAMECARAGRAAPTLDVLDTLGMARRVLHLPSYSLGNVADHLGVSRGRAHRAADDAHTTWHVAWGLLDRADPSRDLGVDGARSLCRRKGPQDLRSLVEALHRALGDAQPIEIEYAGAATGDGGGNGLTRRAITVRRVTTSRVEAFCHLRNEDRVFRLDRIRLV